jgi:hypothetical protein
LTGWIIFIIFEMHSQTGPEKEFMWKRNGPLFGKYLKTKAKRLSGMGLREAEPWLEMRKQRNVPF